MTALTNESMGRLSAPRETGSRAITMRFDSAAASAISDIALFRECSVTEVMRKALAVYQVVEGVDRDGGSTHVVDREGAASELVIDF